MNRRVSIAVLVATSTFALAGPVSAQFYPGGYGYGGYGWGGTNGSAALLGADYQQAAAMQAKAQSRQVGQEAAMAQNAVVQGGIRNTLSNQAQSRTDAILDKRQANQDWWFQYQSQQASERRNTSYATAAPGMSSGGGRGFGPPGGPPPVAMDIIKWPVVLQDSCFASERTKIEAPYRHTPPKLSAPTAADYRQMAGIVDDMKAVLEWRLKEGIPTDQYDAAKAFLNTMGQEAASRSGAAGASAQP